MKCVKCGKDIVEYKEKRVYYSSKIRGNVTEYICKDCYVEIDNLKGDVE